MQVEPSARTGHLPALDGLRGLAVLLVLVFHSIGLRATPDDGLLHWIGRAGWIGVDLFFVLSGFLITRILIRQAGRAGGLRVFYARRALRIFPLYYLFLAVVFGLGAWIPALQTEGYARVAENQGWLWLYASNVKVALSGDLGAFGWGQTGWIETTHFWSLAIEEQFYLLWPPLVLALSPRRRIVVIAALCVAAPLLRVLLVGSGHELAAYVSTPCRMDALGAGALAAALTATGPVGARGLRLARGLVVSTTLAALGLSLWRGGYENLDPVVVIAGYSLNAAGFAALLVLCVALPASHGLLRLLSTRGLRGVGRVSYGVYVLHLPLVKLLFVSPLWEHPAVGWAGGAALFLALTAVSLLLAQAVFAVWERPFLELKRFVRYPAAPAALAEPETSVPTPPTRLPGNRGAAG